MGLGRRQKQNAPRESGALLEKPLKTRPYAAGLGLSRGFRFGGGRRSFGGFGFDGRLASFQIAPASLSFLGLIVLFAHRSLLHEPDAFV